MDTEESSTSKPSNSETSSPPPPPKPPALPTISKVAAPMTEGEKKKKKLIRPKLPISPDDQGAMHAPDVWDRSDHVDLAATTSSSSSSSSSTTEEWKAIRIVCISDTHCKHDEYLPRIPDGDVLIHSGDFFSHLSFEGSSKQQQEEGLHASLNQLNNFMKKLPHKLKIFVAGNHEIAFNGHSREDIQAHLPDCVYLQDSSISIANGSIKLYGTPWTSSRNMGFSSSEKELDKHWSHIPEDVDILITHSPPFNVLDLAFSKRSSPGKRCQVCGDKHPNREHWGSLSLLERIGKLKPKVHLFGHVHDIVGVTWAPAFDELSEFHQKFNQIFPEENHHTLFVNSSMDLAGHPIYFDYHFQETGKHSKKEGDHHHHHHQKCTVS